MTFVSRVCAFGVLCGLQMVAVASPAEAALLKFTATSAGSGILGFLVYDDSVFAPGNPSQFVSNSFINQVDFTDPATGLRFTTPGPSNAGTFFNNTGALPTVTGGFGSTAVSGQTPLFLASTFYVQMNQSYSDVTWSTSAISAPVPEPATWGMMTLGFGAMGYAMRRKNKVATRIKFA